MDEVPLYGVQGYFAHKKLGGGVRDRRVQRDSWAEVSAGESAISTSALPSPAHHTV